MASGSCCCATSGNANCTCIMCKAAIQVPVLDAELHPQSLSRAAQYGLPQEWVTALVKYDPERRQVLKVRSCVAGSQASTVLKDGDLLLAVSGKLVSNFRDVEQQLHTWQAAVRPNANGVQDPSDGQTHPSKRQRTQQEQPAAALAPCDGTSGAVEGAAGVVDVRHVAAGSNAMGIPLTICRDGHMLEVQVHPGCEDGLGSRRVVHWCGAQVQGPPRCVRELGYTSSEGSGVYISRWHHGSPAHRYGLYAMHWLLSVNGVPTPDLDAFVRIVSQLPVRQTLLMCDRQ